MSNFSHFATKAIHVGNESDQWKCHAVVPPIFLSTTFEEKEPGVTYVRTTYYLAQNILLH